MKSAWTEPIELSKIVPPEKGPVVLAIGVIACAGLVMLVSIATRQAPAPAAEVHAVAASDPVPDPRSSSTAPDVLRAQSGMYSETGTVTKGEGTESDGSRSTWASEEEVQRGLKDLQQAQHDHPTRPSNDHIVAAIKKWAENSGGYARVERLCSVPEPFLVEVTGREPKWCVTFELVARTYRGSKVLRTGTLLLEGDDAEEVSPTQTNEIESEHIGC